MKTGAVLTLSGGRIVSSNVKIALLLVALCVFTLLYLLTNDQLGTISTASNYGGHRRKYLVYGQQCQIPNSDPFDVSVQEFLAPTTPVICSTQPLLTRIQRTPSDNHLLVIQRSVQDRYKVVPKHHIECCYSIVERVAQSMQHYTDEADKKYNMQSCKKMKERTTLSNTTEFVYVRCMSVPRRSQTGRVVYENMHAVIPKKHPRKIPPVPAQNHTKPLNVLIIGIDSISRLNLRRTMPATLSYLNSNSWMEMEGYNKIADNTLPNLMAILSGLSLEKLDKTYMKNNWVHNPADNCPTLWKDFKAKGYLTAYAEDVPSISTFNYRKIGFVEQPTDYYMRPYMLAAHHTLFLRNKDSLPICIGPQSAADIIFDYALDFATTLRAQPHFGLFWLNSFSHNDLNSPAALDLRLLHLLKQLDDVGVYDNTAVLVLSDHGIRFGKIRTSFQGYLEERLPFLFLHFPPAFLEKHPDAKRSLELNRNRLTSPYDVYATLSHLLGDSKIPASCATCHTLTREVSQDRGCPDAGIDPHWCTCPRFTKLPNNDTTAKEVAQFLTETIENKTRHLVETEKAGKDLCAHRILDAILRIHRGNNMDYVIVIQTEPFGLFEATLRAKEAGGVRTYQVLGFISRLDSYFGTSKCVHTSTFQLYCHCV